MPMPASASRTATAWPMPPEAPMTMAIRSVISISSLVYDMSIYALEEISMTDRPRRGRGRRPAAEVREEILEASAELLFDEGMAGFTIQKGAKPPGASKRQG